MSAGKLYVIEGSCDGVGKSTQLELLRNTYPKDKTVSQHFPAYESESSFLVKKYLDGSLGSPKEVPQIMIERIYAIDRYEVWRKKLQPLYEQGKIILLDRYTTSSLIYQSALAKTEAEQKSMIEDMMEFEYQRLGIKEPDKVIFLNGNFDIIQNIRSKRTNNEGIQNDVHERDLDLMYKFYQSANYVSKLLNWDEVDVTNETTMRPKEEIHEDILKLVRKKY